MKRERVEGKSEMLSVHTLSLSHYTEMQWTWEL